MRKCKIGLLNFSEIDRDKHHMDGIQELLDYAELADQLGFSRFWLGEHYLHKKLQYWTNPEMLVPIIAGYTKRIKVGLAGSLISIHGPLDVATNFKLLANLFPGRIDLGFAKGGTKELGQHTISLPFVLKETDPNELFKGNAQLIAGYLHAEKFHFDNGLVLPPAWGHLPDLWLLGSSYKNFDLSLELGANFSRSLFHLNNDPDPGLDFLNSFRERFHSNFKKMPDISIAIAGCCHENSAVAKKIVEANFNSGTLVLDQNNIIYGSAKQFCDQLYLLQEKYDADEIILLQLYNDQSDKLKGIELIARELNLS